MHAIPSLHIIERQLAAFRIPFRNSVHTWHATWRWLLNGYKAAMGQLASSITSSDDRRIKDRPGRDIRETSWQSLVPCAAGRASNRLRRHPASGRSAKKHILHWPCFWSSPCTEVYISSMRNLLVGRCKLETACMTSLSAYSCTEDLHHTVMA